MTNTMEHALPANSTADGREREFGCTVMELRKLMELRSREALRQINDHHGGVMNLCSKLRTDPVEGKGHVRSGELEEVAGVKKKKIACFQLPRGVWTMTGRPASRGESVVYEALKGAEAREGHGPPHTREVEGMCCSLKIILSSLFYISGQKGGYLCPFWKHLC